MKISVAIFALVVCFCLFETLQAKHIRRKRAVSEDFLSELDRELKNYINRRDDKDGKHVCEQEIDEDFKNKVRNRGDEIISAAAEMGRDFYFTSLMFAGINEKDGQIDLESGIKQVAHILGALGIVAHTPRGEEYVVRLVEDSKDIAKIAIDSPVKANKIFQIIVQSVKEYAEENFQMPDDASGAKKRGTEADVERDEKLVVVMTMFCAFNRQTWKEVVTDVDKLIDDGLEILRGTSTLLRSIRAIVSSERADKYGEVTMMGLGHLAMLTLEGDQAKINEAYDHAEKIRAKVEQAIKDSGIFQHQPEQQTSESSKRVLHGVSKDALMEFLNKAMDLYHSQKKK